MNLLVRGSNEQQGSWTSAGENERFSGLCEDLFPEMASSSAFDGVQILVNPREVNRPILEVRAELSWVTHSSAPSMVTSMSGY